MANIHPRAITFWARATNVQYSRRHSHKGLVALSLWCYPLDKRRALCAVPFCTRRINHNRYLGGAAACGRMQEIVSSAMQASGKFNWNITRRVWFNLAIYSCSAALAQLMRALLLHLEQCWLWLLKAAAVPQHHSHINAAHEKHFYFFLFDLITGVFWNETAHQWQDPMSFSKPVRLYCRLKMQSVGARSANKYLLRRAARKMWIYFNSHHCRLQ